MQNLLACILLCATAFGQGVVVLPNTTVLPTTAAFAGTGLNFSYKGGATANCHIVTSCAVTVSPTAGDLVIVDIALEDTTAGQGPTLTTDNGTSTWVNRFASGQDPTGNFYFNEDSTLSVSSGVTTITAHFGAATTSSIVIVTEYHRSSGSWAFDSASTLGRVTTPSTSQTCPTSITPSSGVTAVINGQFYTATGEDAFLSSGNYILRFSVADIFSGDEGAVLSNIVPSTSGSYSAAATNGSSVTYECFTTAYK